MFKNQGTSLPVASQFVNGDMASEWEELVELDDVQLATIVGGSEILDIDIPNYKIEELIKAGFRPLEGSAVQIEVLLKKP